MLEDRLGAAEDHAVAALRGRLHFAFERERGGPHRVPRGLRLLQRHEGIDHRVEQLLPGRAELRRRDLREERRLALHEPLRHAREERAFVREELIQTADRGARALRDRLRGRGLEAGLREHRRGGIQDRLVALAAPRLGGHPPRPIAVDLSFVSLARSHPVNVADRLTNVTLASHAE